MRSHALAVVTLVALVVLDQGCHAGDLFKGTTTGRQPFVPSRLAFTKQPGSAVADSALPTVRVSALDSGGSLAPAFSGPITLSLDANPGSGTLTGTMTATAVNGVAMFADLRIDHPGAGYTLRAVATGLREATSQSFDITSTQPPARRLRFTVQPPASTEVGQTLTALSVAAIDSLGTVVTRFTGAITVAILANPGAGTLSGTRTVDAISGVATFANLSINNAGTGYTLQATSSGLTSANSSAFDITAPPPPPPPPATQVRFTVQPTNTLPLVTITPAIEVTALDAQGNPVTGFAGPITIAIGHDASLLGNARLSGTLTVNAVDGVAHFSDLSIDQIGIGYTLRATASGLTSGESAAFNIGTP